MFRRSHPKTVTRTKDAVLTALFAALIAAGAFIRIPTPLVPVTLQFAFTLLAAQTLGAKAGNAVAVYVLMGLIGLPVFTEGGGIMYVLKPSFGYLIGMVAGTYICGFIAERHNGKLLFRILASLAALVTVDLLGVSYMYLIMKYYLQIRISLSAVIISGALIFLPTDLTWSALTAFFAFKLKKSRAINR